MRRRMRVTSWDRDFSLLLVATAPLREAFDIEGIRVYWTRHWRRGQHIRIIPMDPLEWDSPPVSRLIDTTLMPALSTLPSSPATPLTVPDRATYRALATAEEEPGPLFPLASHLSVEWEEHDDRSSIFGSGEVARAVEEFIYSTGAAAADAVAEGKQGAVVAALDLMIAVAHRFGRGIDTGFISYRSHAEGFLGSRGDEALRSHFDAVSRRLQPHIVSRVGALTSADATDPADDASLAAISALVSTVEHANDRGVFSVRRQGVTGNARLGALSRFHALAQRDYYQQALHATEWFQLYRLALNACYLHLTRIGLSAVDRFLLCHAVADAVEHQFGVSAVDILSGSRGSA